MASMSSPQRLGTAQSQGNLSVHSRMSESRREKLLHLQKREELKDALTEKLRSRFGRGSNLKADDEVSVCSTAIRQEVSQFAMKGNLTANNLARLERRIQSKAKNPGGCDAASEISAYSGAGSTLSRSRSVPSIAGSSIVGGATGKPKKMDWSKLDEYASYLHEQDCIRQNMGIKALQNKFRSDLDQQVQAKNTRKVSEQEEDNLYHNNTLVELERWKQMEQLRAEEKAQQLAKEKEDRDAQLAYERKLKAAEVDQKKDEEAELVTKIVTEMEAEQRKIEEKKEQQRQAMRKVFEENAADQIKRQEEKRALAEQESAAIKEYARALDEQEAQRAADLKARLDRQDALMKQLQGNADGLRQGAGSNDHARAVAQQEEMDRHYQEAENVKQNRLKQMRVENQAYLLKQIKEKEGRKHEDRELSDIQAMILEADTDEYNEIERQKVIDRKARMVEHSKDIKSAMVYKMAQSAPEMSDAELLINKPLIKIVHRTLDKRDAERAAYQATIPESPEEDE